MNNLHPVFAQALKPFIPASICKEAECIYHGKTATPSCMCAHEMKKYRDALASFDWQYDFCDDHKRWAAGNNALANLYRMQREVDPTGEIWMATPGANSHGAPRPRIAEAA